MSGVRISSQSENLKPSSSFAAEEEARYGAMIDIQGPGAVVRYSPCVVARRLRRAARVTIARERGWAEVF